MLGRLRRSAARDQDREVFVERFVGPEEMIVSATSCRILPGLPICIQALDRRRIRIAVVEVPHFFCDTACSLLRRKNTAVAEVIALTECEANTLSSVGTKSLREDRKYGLPSNGVYLFGPRGRVLSGESFASGGCRFRFLCGVCGLLRPQRRHHGVEVERGCLLTRRVLDEVLDLGSNDCLSQVNHWNVIDHPIEVGIGVEFGALERIATQVDRCTEAAASQTALPRLAWSLRVVPQTSSCSRLLGGP